jgi:hypothetical protein
MTLRWTLRRMLACMLRQRGVGGTWRPATDTTATPYTGAVPGVRWMYEADGQEAAPLDEIQAGTVSQAKPFNLPLYANLRAPHWHILFVHFAQVGWGTEARHPRNRRTFHPDWRRLLADGVFDPQDVASYQGAVAGATLQRPTCHRGIPAAELRGAAGEAIRAEAAQMALTPIVQLQTAAANLLESQIDTTIQVRSGAFRSRRSALLHGSWDRRLRANPEP